jgi:hypothetical protein
MLSTAFKDWLVPLTVAFIAGLFSFLNLVLSKEQKVSELRQAWIDGLRDDLAALITAVFVVKYLFDSYEYQHGDQVNHVDLSKTLSEPHTRASSAFHRILLRLNPVDKSLAQKELVEELTKLRDYFVAEKYADACSCAPTISKKGQLVLKAEWKRVKRGEPIFRWSKRIALLLVLSVIALGGFFAWQMRSQLHTGVTPVTAGPFPQTAAPRYTATATPAPTEAPTPTATLTPNATPILTPKAGGASSSARAPVARRLHLTN